ncbi:MAG: hypothetical protein ABEJ31_14565 [Haloarculaceae archaeon]
MSDCRALRERARDLASAPPEERSALLAAADDALPAPDARVLHAVFDPEAESFAVGDALRLARDAGHARDDGLCVLADALRAPDLQARWARSQDIERRDEVLSRLQVLARTPTLVEDLVPFLTLHLRSPDPAVYQAAAVAVGRHLETRPELLASVRDYAAARELDLGEPTTLGGNRTRRRVLLVQAAARASPHGEETDLPALLTAGLPLDPDAVRATDLAADAEDATIVLLASRLLLEEPDLIADVAPLARDLAATLPAGALADTPPILFQRWGELVDALLAGDLVDATTAANGWTDRLERIAAALRPAGPTGGVPELTHALFLLDEHARTLAVLPDAVGRIAASGRDALPATHRALLDKRVRLWRRQVRNDAPPEGWPRDVPDDLPNASPALRLLLRPRPASTGGGVGGVGPAEFDVALIGDLVAPLGERSRWEALAPGERAIRLVFLLSAIHNLEDAHERVRAILRSHAIPVPPGDDARSQALAAVILRLIRFEGAACARAIDSRIRESVSDLGVLMILLPTEEAPGLAADLADNLEHQLRWNLQLEPDFRPIQVLVRTTVRDPHPAFYRALEDLLARRSYADAGGRSVPLEAALAAIRRDDADAGTDPWRDDALAGADPLVSARSGARDRLAAVTTAGASIWDAVEALLEAIGVPAGARDRPADDTLLGLVELVHPADDRMLASGPEPWHDETPDAFVARHAETVNSIRGRLGAVRPESVEESADARDAIDALVDDLSTIVDALLAVLPAVEAERLREIVAALDARIEADTQALDALVADWDPVDPPRSPERWASLLEEVSERWTPPDRLPILRATFASLTAASVPAESADAWADRRRFLAWAVAAPDGRTWTDAEVEAWEAATADVWRDLLEEAMAAGQEARVRDLLEAPSLEAVRDRPASVEVLRAAREWALDRYLLGAATRVRARLPTAAATPRWRVRLREFGAFLLHHSPVWTALIVGAILMQDFGTAWQAMAEQGDIQGIAITFTLAVAGAFGYVLLTLHRKTTPPPGVSRWAGLRSRLTRASLFVAACWAFTLVVTAFLWWLLSGTDQVVHGPRAVLHVVVWSSFALLAGIFLGLVAKAT